MPSSLADEAAFSDTDSRPEANRSNRSIAQGNIAMNTLFDDIATTLVTAAFAIASASGMIALLAGAF